MIGCAKSLAATSLLLTAFGLTGQLQSADKDPRSRHFMFHYGATLKNVPDGAKVRVWLPVPQNNSAQSVAESSRHLPSPGAINSDATYGNKILYFEATGSEGRAIPFSVDYEVHRREVLGLRNLDDRPRSTLTQRDKSLFLSANAMVPTKGKPLDVLLDFTLPKQPLQLAQALYDRVDSHVAYDKSKAGYGQGNVLWVCDSQTGNCTDFHSLFISLARSMSIPAKFEIGFPLPEERGKGSIGGYHCWAYFHVEQGGWIPVDISEADKHPNMKSYYFGNLTENRITFSFGRDLVLTPKQTGAPLNYFVYPYVEVDGQLWPKEKINLDFRYRDLDRNDARTP